MKKIVLGTIALFLLIGNNFALAKDNIPNGWYKAGKDSDHYEISIDKKNTLKGKNSIFITAIKENPDGFVTLMQNFKADKYISKRVRLSAYIKTESLTGWTGLWMRIDGINKNINFDNMENRKIAGTTDWKKYDVVLDILQGSKDVAFGILSSGTGKVWVTSFNFEVVDKNIKVTNLKKEPEKPVNLELK